MVRRRRLRIKDLSDPQQRAALSLARRFERRDSAIRGAERALARTASVGRALKKARETKGLKFVAPRERNKLN